MKRLATLIVQNLPRKLVALLIATLIWVTINQQMMITRRFIDVPIRVTNLSSEKTIQGLSHSGHLEDQRVELVITGRRFELKNLSTSDLEVAIDASGQTGLWQPEITRANIYDARTKMPMERTISRVQTTPMTLYIVPLVKKSVPIMVVPPRGDSPIGYTFMNIWPMQYSALLCGSKREIEFLEERGIPLQFDLGKISKAELDALSSNSDIARFEVPSSWKKITLPLPPYNELAINDQSASHIYINFLKNELIPIGKRVPVALFFTQTDSSLNPETIKIRTSELISAHLGQYFLNLPIYAGGVSPLFATLIQDHLQIVLYFSSERGDPIISWAPNIIASNQLRRRYAQHIALRDKLEMTPQLRDRLEKEFMAFITKLRLYIGPQENLKLNISLEDKTLIIDYPHKRKTDHA